MHHRPEPRARVARSFIVQRTLALGLIALGAFVTTTLAPAGSAVPARRTAAAAHATPHPNAAARAKPRGRVAPADEYFGRLQMSVLGVRSKVKDLGLLADLHPERRAAVMNNAVWVEDAMRDWARKYPFDRWLPRYAWALEEMYERIPGEDAHRRAIKQLGYITAYFPQTLYAKVGRAKLAEGVPTPIPDATDQPQSDLQRLALIDGKVLPTLPPSPEPSASASAAPGTLDPAAAPSLAPLPTATAAAATGI